MKNFQDTFNTLQSSTKSDIYTLRKWLGFYADNHHYVCQCNCPVIFDYVNVDSYIITSINHYLDTIGEHDSPVHYDSCMCVLSDFDFSAFVSYVMDELKVHSVFGGTFKDVDFYYIVPDSDTCSHDCMFH